MSEKPLTTDDDDLHWLPTDQELGPGPYDASVDKAKPKQFSTPANRALVGPTRAITPRLRIGKGPSAARAFAHVVLAGAFLVSKVVPRFHRLDITIEHQCGTQSRTQACRG